MSKTKIELTKEQEDLINQFGNVICSGGKTYTFMPFWFEKDDEEKTYQIHSLDRIPVELKKLILSFRDKKDSGHIPKENCHTPEHHDYEIDYYGNCLGCTDKEKL